MEFYQNYLNNLSETYKDYYENYSQAVIDTYWEDNINIKKIKEQEYPFTDNYTEYDAIIDTVSDVTINTQKIIGDYIYIMFKDINHPLNHRGQKYLYDPDDNGSEQTYLCYDKLQPLSLIPEFKAIRCNNYIKWKDKENGKIIKEPCFIGYELSSTNNQTSKEGTISQRRLVVLIQGNENTFKIVQNQRFMLNHKRVFKITEINDMVMEDINEENVTMLTFYIEWDALLPKDNKELNICDYYEDIYSLEINQNDIEQISGYKGTLTATVKLDNEILDNILLEWISENPEIVSIDNQGNYDLLGINGESSIITCRIKDNPEIKDSIVIKIVEDYLGEKIIKITPIVSELEELDSIEFQCGVYINEIKQSDIVLCEPNWIGDNYTLEETIDGYKLTNNYMSNKILKLTFSSGSCEPVIMDVKLIGMI